MGLPSMRPTGWFQVAWSADLEVGDVKPLHYFGAELVAFRDLDGAARVLDAHCQHMGADLSHGGCVVEGGIQCPFHGWVWSGDDGHNVRIPYEPHAEDVRRVRCWPTAEFNECIYVWHDLRHRTPVWPAPDAWGGLDDPNRQPLVPTHRPRREAVLRRRDGASSGGGRKLGRPPALPVRAQGARQPDPARVDVRQLELACRPSASAPEIQSKYVGMGSV